MGKNDSPIVKKSFSVFKKAEKKNQKMIKWSKKSNLTCQQALACRPVPFKEIRQEMLENGEILLIYPVNIRPWLKKISRWLGHADVQKPLTHKLQLDIFGTEIWNLMDGKQSVKQIIQLFSKNHNASAKDVEIAVTRFIRDLGKRGLIGLK